MARRSSLAVAALTAVLGAGPATSYGAGTDPTLALASAEAYSSSSGSRAVAVSGTFNVEDLFQFTFPLGLIVSQGDRFVRFAFDGTPRTGTSSLVSNGITAEEIGALMSLGAAAPAPAAIVLLQRDRVVVTLPSDFQAGNASVIVYAILEGDAFISNAVTVTLP